MHSPPLNLLSITIAITISVIIAIGQLVNFSTHKCLLPLASSEEVDETVCVA